ncbi:MAG TPA: hypothetical protein VGG39_14525 [Polyangiaceae bacterium]
MLLAARRLPSALAQWLFRALGAIVLVWSGLRAFGGKAHLWAFGVLPDIRFTSMAILTGTLRLRNGIRDVVHDEQIHDGATYTNWGFGVPFLQAPFHLVANHLRTLFPARFFPDRAIYFVYFVALVPLLWSAFHRLVGRHGVYADQPLRRHVLSWSAALLASTCALYPLMATRFYVYEETIAYFELFELAAMAAYVFAAGEWRAFAVIGVGAAAGVGLLVRPTGLLYVGVWAFMIAAGSRRRRPVAMFVAGVAPFVAVWMWTNVVRSGSPFDFGLENSTPGTSYHTPMLRFGGLCSNDPGHLLASAGRLLRALFVQVPTETPAWLARCHFDLETRPPESAVYARDAFLGPVVLALLAWILFSQLARRERRLTAYAPIAALAALVGAYALAGAGFTWRYAGDLWPLVLLACVEYVRVLPASRNRWLGMPLATALVCASAIITVREVSPGQPTIVTLDPDEYVYMWGHFEDARHGKDPPLASRIACGDRPIWPWHNALGWDVGKQCTVDTFSNVYLGVRAGEGRRRTLRFVVDHAEQAPLRVYVNGRTYRTRTEGNTYVVDVSVDSGQLLSPAVQITIEWVPVYDDPPALHLQSVELV